MATKFTNKQRVFIEEYLRCWNGTEAATRAGYKKPRQMATENLSKPYIAAEIDRRIQEKTMSADECLSRLADIARADMGDFLDTSSSLPVPDLRNAQGKTHLIKKYRAFKAGRVEIELHDPLAALDKIARAHGLYTERHEITIDWRQEVEKVGIEPSDIFERLVAYIAGHPAASD